MKYGFLRSSSLKRFKLPTLNGGVDLKNPKNEISDNALLDCKNVWYKNGRLKSRPGINALPRNALTVEKRSQNDEPQYKLYDRTVNLWDTEYRILTAAVCTDDFMYTLNVYLAASEINIRQIASFSFLRFSSDEFKIPENIIFFSGEAQNGCGIFAFMTLRNEEDYSDKSYNIYELSENLDEWLRVYDYYVPTVLVNGRGNNYDLAYIENNVSLPEPKTVESLNLLNGKFTVYFSSDGRSNMFRLPMSNLSLDAVSCRIYYTSALYAEWNISAGSVADTQSFMGRQVMMEIDREKGAIFFTSSGEEVYIPVMSTYNQNNIMVTAVKETQNGFMQVVDSSCSFQVDGRIYLAGGYHGNTLLSAKNENPLYFPIKSTVDIGGNEGIIALSVQDKKLIAFKENEIHSVMVTKGERINEVALLPDDDTIFKAADTLKTEQISVSVGCGYKDSLCRVGSKNIWLGADCQIYALSNVGFEKVIKLSNSILLNNSFDYYASNAVSDGKFYILSAGNTALVCDCSQIDAPKWYLWEFASDINICGGFYKKQKLYFLCGAGNSGIFYIASLDGDCDIKMLFNDNDDVISLSENIVSFVKTKEYTPSGLMSKNSVEGVYFALSGKGNVEIKINSKKSATVNLRFSTDDYDKGEYKTVMLTPHLYNTEGICFEILSNDAFSIGGIEIFYRKTG